MRAWSSGALRGGGWTGGGRRDAKRAERPEPGMPDPDGWKAPRPCGKARGDAAHTEQARKGLRSGKVHPVLRRWLSDGQ